MVSTRTAPPALLLALVALGAPAAARGHGMRHEVRRDGAVALRVLHHDGEPLAGAAWQAFSPADPVRPWARGQTDRAGYAAFLPDVPGGWRVKVVTGDGHGLVAEVAVEPPAAPVVGRTAGPGEAPPSQPPPGALPSSPRPAGRGLLAPVGLVALLFSGLWFLQRRRARATAPGEPPR